MEHVLRLYRVYIVGGRFRGTPRTNGVVIVPRRIRN